MVQISELPQENELVIGIIKKILPYGAFCALQEYNNLEAFMHISEVAPRWIKNIHEFISEGQTHVLKVHHVDLAKRQIDISLKRVSEEERKLKLASIREEKKLKKLLEVAISNSKSKLTEPQVREELEKGGDPFTLLEELANGNENLLDQFDLPKSLKAELSEIAKKSMKKALEP
ncbi:S1 RNA-binding domain-containing protein [Candidatus Micrarchaeota archaeon]|nr:S1 RNA-binding domain-containing protein [Candidatus Micrarchaeota archaeon]